MTRILSVFGGAAILVAVLALSGSCAAPPPHHIDQDAGSDAGGQACVFDSDCQPVGFCNNGICAICPETPCPAGETCNAAQGNCVPCTAGTCSTDGGTSTDGGNRDGGTTTRDGGKGDAGGCTSPSQCGQQTCVNGVCVACTTDQSCGRAGYICNNGKCQAGCRQDSDCANLGAGYWCNSSNQCQWGCLPQPNCAQFCCNLGTCDTTSHQCTGFTTPDGGVNTGDGGVNIPDGGFTLPDGGSTTGLCFGGTPPSNGGLFFLWLLNCGCDLPASCNTCDPVNGCAQQCAPLQGSCCISSGGLGCASGSDCCSGVCNGGTCN